jgi:hypothetical protein
MNIYTISIYKSEIQIEADDMTISEDLIIFYYNKQIVMTINKKSFDYIKVTLNHKLKPNPFL